MLIFQAAGSDDGETYIDTAAIIAVEDKGDAGTFVHLSGGRTVVVDAMPSKIVAQTPEAGVSVRVPAKVR